MPTLTIQTFGYDYGDPKGDYKHIADVRNISTTGLDMPRNGLSKRNYETIINKSAAKNWLSKMKAWQISDGDRIAIGCSHGFHRAPAMAKLYAEWLRERGWTVNIRHRDISKR